MLPIGTYGGYCAKCSFAIFNKTENTQVSEIVRSAVWSHHNGANPAFAHRVKNIYIGSCYVCGRIIYSDDYHIRQYQPGEAIAKNLRPTCKRCVV